LFFFFSSRRRHTRFSRDWSSDVCSSDLPAQVQAYEPSPQMMDRWSSGLRAADGDRDNVISILDVIGEDWWTGEGVTAKRIGAARSEERRVGKECRSRGGAGLSERTCTQS